MTDNTVAAFDALSDLPEFVLHRIMSLLCEQDGSRIAVVSKWLNHVWETSSIVNVESPSSANGWNGWNYRFNLIDSLSRLICRLDKRQFRTTIGLQKLRVHAMFYGHNYKAKINHLISLALDNRVEEIDLCHVERGDDIHHSCKLWGDSFSGRSVRVIKIKNFDLQAWDLDSVTAQTEELILDMCSGFDTIHINRDSSLKVVDIQRCSGLRRISFDSSASLQSLTLRGGYIEDVILEDCRSLKDLTLQLSYYLDDASLAHILSQCPVLEAFTITGSRHVRTISFHSPTLKKINVIKCEGLRRIQISAKSLQSCKFDMEEPSELCMEEPNDCEIDIKQCESIRNMHLYHSDIDYKWIKENLWKLCWLEDLSIEFCSLLKKVKLPNERIKSLRLVGCPHLKKVEISSPLLESYSFSSRRFPPDKFEISSPLFQSYGFSSRSFPRHKFLHSHKVRASLGLKVTWRKIERFRDFLGGFHLCEELTLTWFSIKKWDFRRSLREIPTYPLYPLKHLRITFLKFEYPKSSIDLMNKILWIALRPEKISLVADPLDTKSIEFQYSEIALEEKNRRCCRGLPFKCWKHSLIAVKLKNMKVDKVTRVVLNYLIKNAPTLRTIYVDSHFFQVIGGKLEDKYDQILLAR